MIISHAKRFVIFRPWKTASQTISVRLRDYSDTTYDQFYHFNPVLSRVVHQHMTCGDFAALPESRLGYFTASFVRNPYDRAYSGFLQLQADLNDQPQAQFRVSWVRDLVMRQLTDNFTQLCEAGFQFDRWINLVTEDQIFEVGRNTSFPLHPAHYWTHLAGQRFVDFLGRVETFEQDFALLCARLGLELIDRVNANVRQAPDDRRYKYIDHMSRGSIDRINQLFKSDFEMLDYERL